MTRGYVKNTSMKKINISVITDSAFIFFVGFILALCFMRYAGLAYPAALILSAVMALAVSVPAFFILRLTRNNKALRRSQEKEKNALMLHLALLKTEETLRLLCAMRGTECTINGFYAKDGDEVLLPLFTVEPLSADRLAEAARKFLPDRITLYCNTLTPAAAELCANLGLTAMTGNEVYLALKEKNLLPEKYICAPQKRGIRQRLALSNLRAGAKSFITGGIGLLIFSLFTLFPVYYIISGAALTLFGAVLKFLPRKEI